MPREAATTKCTVPIGVAAGSARLSPKDRCDRWLAIESSPPLRAGRFEAAGQQPAFEGAQHFLLAMLMTTRHMVFAMH